MLYRVYIIQSTTDRFYIGLSDDLSRRLNDHNSGKSKWTKGKRPWSLVWTSEAMSLSEARKLENRLKSMKVGQHSVGAAWRHAVEAGLDDQALIEVRLNNRSVTPFNPPSGPVNW